MTDVAIDDNRDVTNMTKPMTHARTLTIIDDN